MHAYTSAWLRHHYPAECLAGVMSEQPGMYSANTLRQEARRWGVGFGRLDINVSGFRYTVERTEYGKRLRPPLSAVKGVSTEVAKALVLERLRRGPFLSLKNLFERIALDRGMLDALDRAGAFDRLVDRRMGLYQVGVLSHAVQPGQGAFSRKLSRHHLSPNSRRWTDLNGTLRLRASPNIRYIPSTSTVTNC